MNHVPGAGGRLRPPAPADLWVKWQRPRRQASRLCGRRPAQQARPRLVRRVRTGDGEAIDLRQVVGLVALEYNTAVAAGVPAIRQRIDPRGAVWQPAEPEAAVWIEGGA